MEKSLFLCVYDKTMDTLFWFIVVTWLFMVYVKTRNTDTYYSWLPTHSHTYPDNEKEILLVEQAVLHRTSADVFFHQKTDRSVSPAFLDILETHSKTGHTLKSLDREIVAHVPTILMHKLWHNRSRPWHVNPLLDRLDSESANNPSYPSGHAYQAWVLYHVLSKKYPELEPVLYQTAERCMKIRVIAGLHFPSDGEYAKRLVLKNMSER